MVTVYLEPIFNASEISPDLVFIRCSLGYDGKILNEFGIKYGVSDVQANINNELVVAYTDRGIHDFKDRCGLICFNTPRSVMHYIFGRMKCYIKYPLMNWKKTKTSRRKR